MVGENDKARVSDDSAYREYFRGMPCFVTVQDRENRLLEANRMFEELFGKVNGIKCWEACKQRSIKCSDCPVEQTFATGRGQSAEETVRTLDGQEVPIIVYTSPIFDDSGQVERVLAISADISGVRKLQRKLNRTRQRAQQLFDEAPCYITVQDRDLHVVSSNRRFKEDFGDEAGHHCWEVYKHRDEPCLECPVMLTFVDGTPQTSEEVVTSISGEQYNVLVHTSPLRDADGKITHVIEMSTNITEIRRLESQLTSLGLLIGSVSHGVKGLLTSIDGGMYLVNSGLNKDNQARVEQGWDIVQRNMRRIRSMVLDILYYAKDRDLDFEEVNVLELAADIWNVTAFRAEELGIEFDREFPVNAGKMHVDKAAIRTALVNLIENAFDACRVDKKKDHHAVRLTVTQDEEGHVVFEVSDNGIGMDQETREKMFSLFFSSKGNEGTGLGMFVSNKIVKQHGGMIEVESQLDMGTTLRVVLKRRQPQALAQPPVVEALSAG